MKNLKIKNKLTIGFTILLIFTVIITAVGTISVLHVNSSYAHLLTYPNYRYSLLRDLESGLQDSQRVVLEASFLLGNASAINGLENEFNSIHQNVQATMQEHNRNLLADTSLSEEYRNVFLGYMAYFDNMFTDYIRHVVTPVFVAARDDNFNQVSALLPLNTVMNNDMRSQFMNIFSIAQNQIAEVDYEMSTLVVGTVWIVLALAIAALALGVAITIIIVRGITMPIRKAQTALNDAANGKLSTNINVADLPKNELGMLTSDIYRLLEVIKAISGDLTKMEREFNVVGDFEYRVDVNKYQNSFRDMIEKIHAVIDDQTKDINTTLDVLGRIGDGDFEITIADMPGKKQVIPQTLRAVVDNLKEVSSDVKGMITATANNGDLNFRIDVNKYEGDWKEITEGLNSIVKAVDEPLKAIEVGIREMQAGNFNLEQVGQKITDLGIDSNPSAYNGAFKAILTAFETTITDTASYIDEIEQILAKMAAGDLRNTIDRDYVGSFDLIKRSVNNISGTLNKTMQEISSSAEQVLNGSSQISGSANTLATGAQQQASSVQELNATIDIINQQTQQNASNTTIANELSSKSTINAQEGNEAMKQMVEAMTQIKESSSDISQIVKTIQDIAFQTNLLALNASVEAARAGEHGKGFSVVAEEVRSLAGRSQAAATETTGLIENSINRVDSGSNIAKDTAESLNAIVTGATEVLEVIGNISTASKEQAESIALVSEGLAQISKVVQDNSAVSEETAAAAQELAAQAEVLKQLVSYFKL